MFTRKWMLRAVAHCKEGCCKKSSEAVFYKDALGPRAGLL